MSRKRVMMWQYDTGGYGYACPLDGCVMTMTATGIVEALTAARLHSLRTHGDQAHQPSDPSAKQVGTSPEHANETPESWHVDQPSESESA